VIDPDINVIDPDINVPDIMIDPDINVQKWELFCTLIATEDTNDIYCMFCIDCMIDSIVFIEIEKLTR
jgi:hypothetical protein